MDIKRMLKRIGDLERLVDNLPASTPLCFKGEFGVLIIIAVKAL